MLVTLIWIDTSKSLTQMASFDSKGLSSKIPASIITGMMYLVHRQIIQYSTYASARVVKLCSLKRENIVRFLSDSDRLRPAYCVALRPETKEVLLVVRGTKALGDVVTILTGMRRT